MAEVTATGLRTKCVLFSSTLCRSQHSGILTYVMQGQRKTKHTTHQPVFRAACAATARRALAAEQLLWLDVSKCPLRGLRFPRSPGPSRGPSPCSGGLWGRWLAADQTTEVRFLAGVALTGRVISTNDSDRMRKGTSVKVTSPPRRETTFTTVTILLRICTVSYGTNHELTRQEKKRFMCAFSLVLPLKRGIET